MRRWTFLLLTFLFFLLLCSCGEREAQLGKEGSAISNTEQQATQSTPREAAPRQAQETNLNAAKLLYMGQASIRITTAQGKVIYIDPYAGDGYEPAADLILVTHGHYDHNDLDKVGNRNLSCQIITWQEALEGGEHQTFDLGYATVQAVEAGYNRWHDVGECVGYVVTLSDGISIYVTGDTSTTEQMPLLAQQKIDYAFFCCDGVFNMDLEEAAECARLVGASHNVPYHVLAQEGVYFDAERAQQFNAPNRLVIDEGEEIVLTE